MLSITVTHYCTTMGMTMTGIPMTVTSTVNAPPGYMQGTTVCDFTQPNRAGQREEAAAAVRISDKARKHLMDFGKRRRGDQHVADVRGRTGQITCVDIHASQAELEPHILARILPGQGGLFAQRVILHERAAVTVRDTARARRKRRIADDG
jgi:hypothetical protein